jgi:hypothetical protein
MLQNAQCVNGNVNQTCRFFRISRALFYIWKKRYEKNRVAGLRNQSRRPHRIRNSSAIQNCKGYCLTNTVL